MLFLEVALRWWAAPLYVHSHTSLLKMPWFHQVVVEWHRSDNLTSPQTICAHQVTVLSYFPFFMCLLCFITDFQIWGKTTLTNIVCIWWSVPERHLSSGRLIGNISDTVMICCFIFYWLNDGLCVTLKICSGIKSNGALQYFINCFFLIKTLHQTKVSSWWATLPKIEEEL